MNFPVARWLCLPILVTTLLVLAGCAAGTAEPTNGDPDMQAVWGSGEAKPSATPSNAGLRERWGQ